MVEAVRITNDADNEAPAAVGIPTAHRIIYNVLKNGLIQIHTVAADGNGQTHTGHAARGKYSSISLSPQR